MSKESKELAVQDNMEVMPSELMAEFAGDGAEDISSNDIQKSYIKVLQKASKDFDAELGKAGDFIDSVTKENFGSEIVVTIVRTVSTWNKFKDDNTLEKVSYDGIKWDDGTALNSDEKWQNKFINCFVIRREENGDYSPFPAIIGFKSTSLKFGSNLLTQLAKLAHGKQREPIFARNYTFYSEKTENEKGAFHLLKWRLNPGFNTAEIMMQAKATREMMKNVEVKYEEGMQPGDETTLTDSDVTI